ncbi:MAG: hypothetical protein AB4062_18205 [Crocosphaera sp.]
MIIIWLDALFKVVFLSTKPVKLYYDLFPVFPLLETAETAAKHRRST